MKVKALVNFSGAVTMSIGEVREINSKEIYEDLLRAKYVEEVKPISKKVKANEN